MNQSDARQNLLRHVFMAILLAAGAQTAPAFEVLHNVATYYDYFGAHPDLPPTASSVGAFARDFERRHGVLRDGEDKVSVDEQDPSPGDADFDGNFTSTPGETVGMRSNLSNVIQPSPLPPAPVRAKANFFANHAVAVTTRQHYFFANTNANESHDDGDPDNEFFLQTAESGIASSSWTDTWTALESATIGLNYRFDGSVRQSEVCPNAVCVLLFPSGTNAARIMDPGFSFEAVFAVFDLSTFVPCEAITEDCDGQSDAPMTVASVSIRGGHSFAEDAAVVSNGDTLTVDLNGTLDVEIVEGHQYFLVSELKIESSDGTFVDFFDTLGLDSVTAPPGSFISDAVQNQGATLNVSAVPLPAAAWLMLTGVGVLAARRRG